MRDEIYFAIDGGGTKSRLQFRINGRISQIFIGESTNVFACGATLAIMNLKALLTNALNTLDLRNCDVVSGCFASAGCTRENEIALFTKFFKEYFEKEVPVKLISDAEAFLLGAFDDKKGAVLISGTGSICLSYNAEGKLVRSGGLGWRLGDEGSAVWIGTEAIKRAIKSGEKRNLPTKMLPTLFKKLNISSIDNAVTFLHSASLDKATLASCASVVTEYGRAKDVLALDILKKAALELALLVKSVLMQNNFYSNQLALTGGVFEHDEIVKAEFISLVEKNLGKISIVEANGGPLYGAMNVALNR